MSQRLLPLAALLLGSAFLLFAGGINALVLPLRGSAEGFSSLSLGLVGTGWAFGYVLGCLLAPVLVARVGHIRSFSVMSAIAGLAVLSSLLVMTPPVWIGLRALSGFCFSGAAMIVESWLGESTEASSRGTVFGIYTTVNLAATTAGQLSLAAAAPSDHHYFTLAAMFYMLALIPTAVSSTASPKPLVRVRLDVPQLYRNSPIAVVAVFLVGISNGAFGTLAAVYATSAGLDLTSVTLFASLPLLAGAMVQVPVGMASDRMDRRLLLIAIAAVGLMADLAFLLRTPADSWNALMLVLLLGSAIFTMYPVIVAHANDHAAPDSHILTSGGLLLVFGLGAIVGPLAAGIAMDTMGERGLFATTACAHAVIVLFAAWRMTRRSGVGVKEKTAFIAVPLARMQTPQTPLLAPHAETEKIEPPEPQR